MLALLAELALTGCKKIKGPVLLLCGGADLVWNSCPFSQQIDNRLTSRGFRFPHQLLSYPDAGHFVSIAANVSYVGLSRPAD